MYELSQNSLVNQLIANLALKNTKLLASVSQQAAEILKEVTPTTLEFMSLQMTVKYLTTQICR